MHLGCNDKMIFFSHTQESERPVCYCIKNNVCYKLLGFPDYIRSHGKSKTITTTAYENLACISLQGCQTLAPRVL